LRELEQTSSAKYSVVCAGVFCTGRISYSRTEIPRSATAQAASTPAKPAPTTETGKWSVVGGRWSAPEGRLVVRSAPWVYPSRHQLHESHGYYAPDLFTDHRPPTTFSPSRCRVQLERNRVS
jgi:hypothetical protein